MTVTHNGQWSNYHYYYVKYICVVQYRLLELWSLKVCKMVANFIEQHS